jgi:hypothetical protein
LPFNITIILQTLYNKSFPASYSTDARRTAAKAVLHDHHPLGILKEDALPVKSGGITAAVIEALEEPMFASVAVVDRIADSVSDLVSGAPLVGAGSLEDGESSGWGSDRPVAGLSVDDGLEGVMAMIVVGASVNGGWDLVGVAENPKVDADAEDVRAEALEVHPWVEAVVWCDDFNEVDCLVSDVLPIVTVVEDGAPLIRLTLSMPRYFT